MTPELRDAAMALGTAGTMWKAWVKDVATVLEERFACGRAGGSGDAGKRVAAARWLIARGCAEGEVSSEVAERLIEMSSDAASAQRQHFPGGVLIARRRGRIGAVAQGTEPDRVGPG